MARRKLIVLGIDGADWEIIERLLKDGHLPNFRHAMEHGSFGPLASTIPALTPPAWTSMFTGVNPGKHGIFDFTQSYHGIPKLTGTEDTLVPYVWELMKERMLVFNIPATYPPRGNPNATVISGFGTPTASSQFTIPRETRDELLGIWPGYETGIASEAMALMLGSKKERRNAQTREEIGGAILANMEMREKAAKHLLRTKEWEAALVAFSETDWLQHEMLPSFFEAGDSGSTPIGRVYARLDAFLGYLIGEGHNVIIVSDHGFQRITSVFSINTYLMQKGLLRLKRQPPLKELGRRCRSCVRGLCLFALGKLPPEAYAFIKKHSQIYSAGKAMIAHSSDAATLMDQEKSSAVVRDARPDRYIIGVSVMSGADADAVSRELMASRGANGRRLVKELLRREDVYHGKAAAQAPELFVVPEPGVCINTRLGSSASEELAACESQHRHSGIFLACGPDFRKNGRIGGLGVADITPTVLSYFGYEPPAYMDGRSIPLFEPPAGRKSTVAGETMARLKLLKAALRKG